jgi:hypothetical protein
MVSSRVATLLSVDKSREVIKVRYVSEPIIGESACLLMNVDSLFSRCLEILVRLVSVGKVGSLSNRGAAGEFVSPILICRAFDRAHDVIVAASRVISLDESVSDESAEPLQIESEILKELLPSSYDASVVLKDVSHLIAPHAGRPVHFARFLETLFLGINFNTRQSDAMVQGWPRLLAGTVKVLQCLTFFNAPFSENLIVDAWSRGAVILTPHCFPGFDYAIPIRLCEFADQGKRTQIVIKPTALFVEVKMLRNNISQNLLSEYVASLYLAARTVISDVTVPIALMVHQVGAGRLARRSDGERVRINHPDDMRAIVPVEGEVISDNPLPSSNVFDANLANSSNHKVDYRCFDDSHWKPLSKNPRIIPEDSEFGCNHSTDDELVASDSSLNGTRRSLRKMRKSIDERSESRSVNRKLTSVKRHFKNVLVITAFGMDELTYGNLLQRADYENLSRIALYENDYAFEIFDHCPSTMGSTLNPSAVEREAISREMARSFATAIPYESGLSAQEQERLEGANWHLI